MELHLSSIPRREQIQRSLRRSASGAPSSKVGIPGPPIKVWLPLMAILAAGLVAEGAIVGARLGGERKVDVFPKLGDRIEATLSQSTVAVVLAAGLLVLLIASVRGARLRWLARRPGPVDVAELKGAGPLPDGLTERLTLRLRERLAELHFAIPGPQPGMAPPTDFVALIGSATHDSKTILAAAAGLLRVAWPTRAYQLQATLVHDARHGCGVNVQVVMLPATTTPPTTCWAPSWEMAIDHAANHAAAFILPRTRLSRRGPWTAWHGHALPPLLLDAYERAAVYTHERRYDEALREYYCALELDPKNLEVRLRIGFIQEKLGLALDALATYQALCDMNCESPAPGARRSTARSIVRTRRRSQKLAVYRRAVLLGSAESLSEQWCAAPGAEGQRRDDQRRAHRERLRPALATLGARVWKQAEARRHTTLAQLLSDDEPTDRRELLLREVFQLAARDALDELRGSLPRDLAGGEENSLTPTAVTLSLRCVELRLRSTRRALGLKPKPRRLRLEDLEAWEADAGLGPEAPWSDRYSAASLYALAISGDVSAGEDALADTAVAHLEHAIEGADSGYVASRRAWLVNEDPDLVELRDTRRFQRFEATYFPSHAPTTRRPRQAHLCEVIEYVHRLISGCADRRQEVWRERLEDAAPDQLAPWLRDELSAWEMVADVASNCGHWQTRLKLVEALETWMARTGRAPLGYPDFATIAPDRDWSAAAIARARDRLAEVHGLAERRREELQGVIGDVAAGDQLGPVGDELIDAWRTVDDVLEPASRTGAGKRTPTSLGSHRRQGRRPRAVAASSG